MKKRSPQAHLPLSPAGTSEAVGVATRRYSALGSVLFFLGTEQIAIPEGQTGKEKSS